MRIACQAGGEKMEISVERWKRTAKKLYLLGHRESQLLLGPAGIGKSESVRQLAEELAKDLGLQYEEYDETKISEYLNNPGKYFLLVDIRLTEVEPADLIGIPRDVNGHVEYKPLGWAVCLNKNPGILFLDEITNVQRLDVQSTMYKLLLERRVGYIPLHKDVLVIAAGNRPEDASIANALPAPAINRVMKFSIKAPKLEEWIEYMHRNYDSWDYRIAAFLKKFGHYYNQKAEEETLEQFATPRKWTRLALISHKISEEDLDCIAEAEVGPEAAVHLCGFLRIRIPEIDVLLRKPERFFELDDGERYFAVSMIASEISQKIKTDNKETLGLSLEVDEKTKKMLQKYVEFINALFERDREMLVILIFLIPRSQRAKLALFLEDVNPEITEFMFELYKDSVSLKR